MGWRQFAAGGVMYLVLMLIVFALLAPLVLFASPVILYIGPFVLLGIVISYLVAHRDNGSHAAGR
jgi:predicted membrane chloride channel (bestrophin family)